MHTSRTRRLSVLVAVFGLVVALSACSSSKKGAASSSGTAAVTILNFKFTTSSVAAGSTVTVRNNDTTKHTVTSDDGTSFNVTVDSGKTATFTAPAACAYKFHCNIHSSMHGLLTVT